MGPRSENEPYLQRLWRKAPPDHPSMGPRSANLPYLQRYGGKRRRTSRAWVRVVQTYRTSNGYGGKRRRTTRAWVRERGDGERTSPSELKRENHNLPLS